MRQPDLTRGASSSAVRLDPVHETLLRVALCPDRAMDEWERLHQRFTVDGLQDANAARLLPLVFHSLSSSPARHDVPELQHLRRIARSAAADNQALFHQLASALAVLAEVGVHGMVLKGVPLALLYYPQPGLRPMADLDLLVRPGVAPTALAALRGAGWRTRGQPADDCVRRGYELSFTAPDADAVLDLHWRLVPWLTRDGRADDPALWAHATPLSIGGQCALGPASHDLLIHVVLHAYRSGWGNVPRWVADATMLLNRAGSDFDWYRFIERVTDARISLPMLDALRYLAQSFAAPIPAGVLRALGGPATFRERRKHRIASRAFTGERHWLRGEFRDLRTGWARASVNLSPAGARRAIKPFLRLRLRVDDVWAVPFVMAARRTRSLARVAITRLGHRTDL